MFMMLFKVIVEPKDSIVTLRTRLMPKIALNEFVHLYATNLNGV